MIKRNGNLLITMVLFCGILLCGGCSQTKNTVMHRGWHNMNARYNGYFYSNENIKESVAKVEKSNKDDFTKLIPLFIYPDNQNAKNFYADFDKSIKKSSVVIQRHTIMDKKTKKEIPNACRWIDENYMLIGISHFYKRDLFSALEAFEYVSKIYPRAESKYGAMIWMIRTNNEIGSFSKSEELLDEIRNATDFPKDKIFQRDLASVTADYYIRRGEYQQAIKPLTKAIALTKSKSRRAREIYVLAQLHEQQKQNREATKYYAMVPGLHPGYDMVFNAQISRARLYDINTDSKLIKKQLMKMLKDDKNIEYQDQIYYALADIAYKEKDVDLALGYLGSSIKTSVSNNTQKAMSYLKRADIYFDRTDYTAAQANYDSTMTVLPKDYPDYDKIDAKKKSLTDLVTNLKVIVMEDSLQRLAGMSESARNAAIDKIIAGIEEEEKRAEEEKANQEQEALNQLNNPTTPVAPTTGAWYFYNSSTVAFGVSEFTKKWGSRKLEDNWRRSEKEQSMITDAMGQETADSVDEKGNPVAAKTTSKTSKKDRNYYLKRIPLTPDELAKSTGRIVDAFYNIGSIYKEQLLNNQKSVESFEELLRRYPDSKYTLSSYYQLYRTYLAMNNQPKAEYYKNILFTKYPESEYVHIIKNPEYTADIAARKSEVEKFYTETYQLYTEGNYEQALAQCKRADSLYSKSPLMPQFSFLKALCIGRTQDINSFQTALEQVVVKYPKEPVKDRAQQMLEMIKKQKSGAVEPKDTTDEGKPKFVFNEKGEYYWVLIVANGKGDLNAVKTKLSDLNAESFSTDDLHISNVFLDSNHQIISVKTFDGKEAAMNYYDFMKNKPEAFADLEAGSYSAFVISAENYTVFYREKNIDEYKTFFTQNFK